VIRGMKKCEKQKTNDKEGMKRKGNRRNGDEGMKDENRRKL
jgi:hypothetical protein